MEKKETMPCSPDTFFLIDPQKKPAFEKDTVVILTKGYLELYGENSCSKYLTKDAVCAIDQCAIFSYAFEDATQDFTRKTSEIEWCALTISTPRADFLEEEDYVKATDLKKVDFY